MRRLILSLIVVGCSICLLTTPVYAKGKPSNPGKSGDAPGQSGDSPGNSGDAPGQVGDSPGNSGNAPGQVKREVSEVTTEVSIETADFVSEVKNERYDSLEDFLYSEAILELTPFERSILSSSDEYEKIKTQMEMTILAYRLDLSTKSETRNRVVKYLDRMEEITKSGKFLGLLFRCRGFLCK